jgi:predicted  nucleic acid-binding Zn-ribbon protein
MTGEEHTVVQNESGQEMDRVREIIFGAHMRDYQKQFQALQRDIDRLEQELDRLTGRVSEQDSDQGKKTQELRREMRQADKELRQELREAAQELASQKVDRVALGELFIELGTQLKAGGSLADLLQVLEEKESE